MHEPEPAPADRFAKGEAVYVASVRVGDDVVVVDARIVKGTFGGTDVTLDKITSGGRSRVPASDVGKTPDEALAALLERTEGSLRAFKASLERLENRRGEIASLMAAHQGGP